MWRSLQHFVSCCCCSSSTKRIYQFQPIVVFKLNTQASNPFTEPHNPQLVRNRFHINHNHSPDVWLAFKQTQKYIRSIAKKTHTHASAKRKISIFVFCLISVHRAAVVVVVVVANSLFSVLTQSESTEKHRKA